MAKIKDQRIFVWCNHQELLNEVVINAVYFARVFEKELCCFANYESESEKQKLDTVCTNVSNTILKDIPDLQVSKLVLPGELSELVAILGNKYNGIMFFCNGKMDNQLLQAFYNSGMPFFFAKGITAIQRNFKRVIIPIDFRNNTKDATLWGSYMGRFNQSDLLLLKANDKSKTTKKQVDEIEAFVKKFFKQFIFHFKIEKGKHSSFGIHNESLIEAENMDLMIVSGSHNVSLLDYIIGSFEKRLVNKAKNVSILLINPERDMYVLCN